MTVYPLIVRVAFRLGHGGWSGRRLPVRTMHVNWYVHVRAVDVLMRWCANYRLHSSLSGQYEMGAPYLVSIPHSRYQKHANKHAIVDIGMTDPGRRSSRQDDSDAVTNLTCFPDPSTASTAQAREKGSAKPRLRGLLDDEGPSMFDENKSIDANDPQSLSAASTEVLQTVIDFHGALELVKRLSTLLAERDAHITALTRLAEEYSVPKQRIVDTSSRAKQAERRRLSLATASEDLAHNGTDSSSTVRLVAARQNSTSE